jgi:hypothetical protein
VRKSEDGCREKGGGWWGTRIMISNKLLQIESSVNFFDGYEPLSEMVPNLNRSRPALVAVASTASSNLPTSS